MGYRPTESEEQQALFSWARLQTGKYPELDLLHHIPNGGKRDPATAARLLREGVKPGVSDLFLPVARGKYHGLYIELKVGKNKVTEPQKEFIERVRAEDYAAVVCYGWESARYTLEEYLKLPRKKEGQP